MYINSWPRPYAYHCNTLKPDRLLTIISKAYLGLVGLLGLEEMVENELDVLDDDLLLALENVDDELGGVEVLQEEGEEALELRHERDRVF